MTETKKKETEKKETSPEVAPQAPHAESAEWHAEGEDFIKKAEEEIEKLRRGGHLPPAVHDWLSAIGRKGRATPPKHGPE